MKLNRFATASIAVALAAAAQPGLARPVEPAFLSAGAPADAPEGYTAMCMREQDLCGGAAAIATPQEPAIDTTVRIAAIDSAMAAAPAAAVADGPALCAVPANDWMTGLAHGDLGEFAAWTSPMRGLRQAEGAPPSFFDDLASPPVCLTGIISPPASSPQAPILATAAIATPRHDPAPAHPQPANGTRQPTGFKLLRAVTRLVNGNIRQRTDMELYGVGEYWNRPTLPGAGDCEDIAIEKRMLLIADGFDPSKLGYAVVYRHDIGLHVVLIARLDDGDFVLDSLSSKVRRWSAAPYTWLRMQTLGNPAAWTAVNARNA